ncbi:MAG: hypothetical protein BroJett014_11300 [Planctomycetota bacterium]|nr:hypothetical protein [Planctomycetota bacterium]GIK52157.1 MAG: hypothetical protein BroJett014_11300 [Planctomycetota bacterium]
MKNENCVGARVRESVSSRSARGGVRVESVQHEIESGDETVVLQSVRVSVRRGDDEHATVSLTVGEAANLYEALADLLQGSAERVFDERDRGSLAGAETVEGDGEDGEVVDDLPVRAGLVLRADDWGRVDGLDDEELADPFELERCAVRSYWPWWMFKLRGGARSPGEPWFS